MSGVRYVFIFPFSLLFCLDLCKHGLFVSGFLLFSMIIRSVNVFFSVVVNNSLYVKKRRFLYCPNDKKCIPKKRLTQRP